MVRDVWWTHLPACALIRAMEITGQAHTVLLDPFWVSRRADQFDQVCR